MRRTWLWLVGLLGAGALLVLQPAPAAQAAAPLHPPAQDTPVCPTVAFTKTVSTDGDPCAANTTVVEIGAGAPVYYCYKVTSPVSSTVAVNLLTLLDGNPPIVVPGIPPGTFLAPGESAQTDRPVPSVLQPAITETSVTIATLNFLAEGLACTAQSNATTVNIVRPQLEITLRVAGAGSDPCTVTTAVNNIGSSSIAQYCLQLKNVGNATFDSFVIGIPQLGIDDITYTRVVAPNTTVNLTKDNIPQLQRTVRETQFTAEARVIGQTNYGVPSEPVYNAATSQSAATITVRKVVTRRATGCPNNSNSPLTIGESVYFCYFVINNGPVELLQQSFTDSSVNASAAFNLEIPVNGTATINNDTLVLAGAQPVLGPFRVTANINGAVTFVSQNQALGFRAQQSSSSAVSVVTPTPRPTDEPTPTWTPPFVPSATPLPTATPFPAMPTATPTWTPAPTWTPPPTVIIFTTPSGQGTPYPPVGGQPGGTQPQAPVDPFAATATASAATATAIFFQTQGNPGGYPAPSDPFAATATASAATATAIFFQTQGNPGGYPAPGDPFAATATASAATATAIFFQSQGNPGGYPAPGDPFAATATASSATATAIFFQPQGDPFAATATASSATATAIFLLMQGSLGSYPAPGDPFAATATPLAFAAQGSPSGYPAPGDPFAATATAQFQMTLTPQVTPTAPAAEVVAATATAAAIAAVPAPGVVTATPGPAVTVLPTQRPVNAPTPAPNDNLLTLLASTLDAAVSTLTFLGLLAGAGLFFAVAIVLIVMTVRTRRPAPYDLTVDDTGAFAPEPPAAAPPATPPTTTDHWPSSLP